jgi:copper chaperone CopZ
VPTAVFRVSDLAGDDCERRLAAALKALPGVHGSVASSTQACVEVDFEDDEVSMSEIVEAGASAGFHLQLVG